MDEARFTVGLLDYIKTSPTPYHAVANTEKLLSSAGYKRLYESDHWTLEEGGSYYVIRAGSSLIAFTMGSTPLVESGYKMLGTHTDSPCLKVKPEPEILNDSYLQLGVEVYGAALLNPWFDRDLSLAGRVSYLDTDREIKHALIDFETPVAVIPSLAIHLDRDANKKRTVNPQKHIVPIVMHTAEVEVESFRDILLTQLQHQNDSDLNVEILDYEMSFYDSQAPAIVGLKNDFIAGARLDNLLSCYVGLMSFIANAEGKSKLFICSDHEEVGSASASGADGPFLRSVLERLVDNNEDVSRMIDKSMMISVDNAHGVHPNYPDHHDSNHGPILNEGPVIKVNANQRYATDSDTSAYFKYLCGRVEMPFQSYVVRTDLACGSTIGPITAAGIGVKTLDVGVPTLAMHSIRELAGFYDSYTLHRILLEYFQ
jgi:aspartyl aminopeptidase